MCPQKQCLSGKTDRLSGGTKQRLPPGGRDALRKYAGGIFLAKAGSKLRLRPGPKAPDGVGWGRMRCNEDTLNSSSRGLLPPLRGPPPSRREAVKSRRFPSEMPWRFDGHVHPPHVPRAAPVPTIFALNRTKSVQRTIRRTVSVAGWICRRIPVGTDVLGGPFPERYAALFRRCVRPPPGGGSRRSRVGENALR